MPKRKLGKEGLYLIRVRETFYKFLQEMSSYRNEFIPDYCEKLSKGEYNYFHDNKVRNKIKEINLREIKEKFINNRNFSFLRFCSDKELNPEEEESKEEYLNKYRKDFNIFLISEVEVII